ncbi:hypothetical protein DRJ22_03970 [Candidatus Woesearchaeota archaeon]|nr:MAG: hypothetical protein B6U93_01845 [Candidatus Woesearchaeota archaeon ex4484_78]RLE45631.1 MAG: hypothetical protein DRJ22_03970 [Candidatus Woesearchaeota archaeon]
MKQQDKGKLKRSIIQSLKSFYRAFPILIGVLLLIGLFQFFMPKELLVKLFQKNPIIDSLIGAGLGSILAGNPITSYILGGELLKQGISLIAITAFLVSWVTVGIVQLPAESMLLGKKFAITRNILSFFFAIIAAIITVLVVNII